MKKCQLAIVIPAYKNQYFNKALESIANQTRQDFRLYIGDDFSPVDLSTIVQPYKNRIDLVYQRFDENLGGKDLVAHWERCIEMVRDEDWIWLFSDDDFMDSNCVESFYQALDQDPSFDLFHFNRVVIDQNDKVLTHYYRAFPDVLSNKDFLIKRLKHCNHSTLVEYIFRKSCFFEKGGFQYFDLAWGSDDALWIKLSQRKGIKTIAEAKVRWRTSPHNISSNTEDIDIIRRKLRAQIAFVEWILKHAKDYDVNIAPTQLKIFLENWFLQHLRYSIEILPFDEINRLLVEFYQKLSKPNYSLRQIGQMYFYKVYRLFLLSIKKMLFWNFVKTQLDNFKIKTDA